MTDATNAYRCGQRTANVHDVEAVFAARLKKAREAAGFSQARLAVLLEEQTGIALDPTAITRIERRGRSVFLREAVAMAQVLAVPMDYLCSDLPEPGADELLRRLEAARNELQMATRNLASAEDQFLEASRREQGALRRVRDLESRLAPALPAVASDSAERTGSA
jgi:transcriptional regulator with XRE-family HTH domain